MLYTLPATSYAQKTAHCRGVRPKFTTEADAIQARVISGNVIFDTTGETSVTDR